MRLGFYHDGRIVQTDSGGVYSGFSYRLWQRYLQVFDDVIATTRLGENLDGLHLSSGPHVAFTPVRSLEHRTDRLTRRREIANEIRVALADVDCAIVRLPSVIGSIAYSVAKRLGKPTMIELVGCPWDAYWNHSLSGKFVAPFAYATTRRQVKNADFVLYVSEHFLQGRYPTNGESLGCSDVILNAADPDTLAQRLRRIKSRSSESPLILGTVAAVDVKFKGHEYVLKAMARLKATPEHMRYWIIGGGDQSRLRSLVSKLGLVDCVRFLGPLPHDEVLAILERDIDLYVQPSLQEGLPRAVLEAMSVGCPAIGSRVGGIPELLSEQHTFNARDVDALASLISRLNNSEMCTMASRNFDLARQHYDVDILETRRAAFLHRLREAAARNE